MREKRKKKNGKITETRYNGIYKDLITENLPEYLCRRKKKKNRCLIARFRYGNKCKGNQYWKEEENKACRICEREIESLEYVTRTCQTTKSDIRIKELLNEDGRDLEDMRRIEKERRNRGER